MWHVKQNAICDIFRETSFVIFVLSAISLGGFLIALEIRVKWLVYLAISIFG